MASAAVWPVCPPGFQALRIVVRCAVNLPLSSTGNLPIGVVRCKVVDELGQSEWSTTPSLEPTRHPIWEQVLLARTNLRDTDDQRLVVELLDETNREVLVSYELGWAWFEPYHEYHLEMVRPKEDIEHGCKLYLSITKALQQLPADIGSPKFNAFEIVLVGLKTSNRTVGSMYCAMKIISNYKRIEANIARYTSTVPKDSLVYPAPLSALLSANRIRRRDIVQISSPIQPQEHLKPYTYLFCEPSVNATLFTPGAALVIEFYSSSLACSTFQWSLEDPIGYAILPLEEEAYSVLSGEEARRGVLVEDLRIEGKAFSAYESSLKLVLRLINGKHPNLAGTPKIDEYLPTFPKRSQPRPHSQVSPRMSPKMSYMSSGPAESQDTNNHLWTFPKTMEPVKKIEFPAYDAVDSLLKSLDTTDQQSRMPIPREAEMAGCVYPNSIIEQQLRELDLYRSTVSRLSRELLTLREEIARLETDNSKLRRELNQHEQTTRVLADSREVDKLSREDISRKFVELRGRVSTQAEILRTYKEEIETLRRELRQMRANERRMFELQHAHLDQSHVLASLHTKLGNVKKMEQAIKSQEEVIEKMEKLLESKIQRTGVETGGSKRVKHADFEAMKQWNEALLTENNLLRGQVDDFRRRPPTPPYALGEADKLELMQKLDAAETRIRSLEEQLQENARLWGKEKAALKRRIVELEMKFPSLSFNQLSSLSDFPLIDDTRRRPFGTPKLDPLRL